jgi:hypothetical protein
MFLIRDLVDIINVLVDICVLQFVCMISLFENDKEKNQSSVFFLIYASWEGSHKYFFKFYILCYNKLLTCNKKLVSFNKSWDQTEDIL